MVNFILVSVLAVFGLQAAAAPASLRTRQATPAPACTSTQYLNTTTNLCNDCTSAFVNSTTCSYQGSTGCSYGSPINNVCTEAVCTGNTYIAVDGKSCIQCADSQAATCDRQGISTSCSQQGAQIVSGACYKPVCNGTVLYNIQENVCEPCSNVYTNASTCDGLNGATGCAYGNFILGRCVPQDCSKNVGTYLSGDGKACVQCPDKGAGTCAPGGGASLTCIQAGARVNSTGQCYKPICTGAVLYNITSNTCVPCSSVFTNASTCTPTAATGCAYGNFMNGKCVAQTCTNNVRTYLSTDGKACVQCPDQRATACGAGGVSTACSYGVPTNGTCRAVPCQAPFFNSRNGTVCLGCANNTTTCANPSAATCASGFKFDAAQGKCVVVGMAYALLDGSYGYLADTVSDVPENSLALCAQELDTYRQNHAGSYYSVWIGQSSTGGRCRIRNYPGQGLAPDQAVGYAAIIPTTCAAAASIPYASRAYQCIDILVTGTSCTVAADGSLCPNYVIGQ